MADFTELKVYDGIGKYHFNRFRVVCEWPEDRDRYGYYIQPANKTTAAFASRLVYNFPNYLNSQYATVEVGDHDWGDKQTFKFKGYANYLGINVAHAHHDWVGRVWYDGHIGFTAQTLKREFFQAGDDLMSAGSGLIVGSLEGQAVEEINRMHFLAGRRSWSVREGKVFGIPGDVFVVETVAVERFSHAAFVATDTVIGLEKKIPDVWIAFLNNFVGVLLVTTVPQKQQGGWQNKDGVDYIQKTFDDFSGLLSDPEFRAAYRQYPTILPVRRIATCAPERAMPCNNSKPCCAVPCRHRVLFLKPSDMDAADRPSLSGLSRQAHIISYFVIVEFAAAPAVGLASALASHQDQLRMPVQFQFRTAQRLDRRQTLGPSSANVWTISVSSSDPTS